MQREVVMFHINVLYNILIHSTKAKGSLEVLNIFNQVSSTEGEKVRLVGSQLNLRSKGSVFESRLIQH